MNGVCNLVLFPLWAHPISMKITNFILLAKLWIANILLCYVLEIIRTIVFIIKLYIILNFLILICHAFFLLLDSCCFQPNSWRTCAFCKLIPHSKFYTSIQDSIHGIIFFWASNCVTVFGNLVFVTDRIKTMPT